MSREDVAYLNRMEAMKNCPEAECGDLVSVDFETYYDKAVSATPLGAWLYARHPEAKPYLMSVHDGKETWVGHPKRFNWASLKGKHLVSHNAYFDICVYEAGVECGDFPRVEFKEWDCTMNLAAFLCNRRSLKDAAEYLLGVDLSKAERAAMEGKRWEDVEHTEQGKRFAHYAADDAVYCWQLAAKYFHCWPEMERRLSRLTIKQGIRGVQIDVEKLDRYLDEAKKVMFGIEQRLPWVSEDKTPTSIKAIANYCREKGIPTPPVKSHEGGEERFLEWEEKWAMARDESGELKYAALNAVAAWRSFNKVVSTLEVLKRRLRDDGTFSFSLKYFGASTGRWAGDAGFNLQNLKKEAVLIDKDFCIRESAADIRAFEAYKAGGERPEWLLHFFDIRSLLIARPGHVFVIPDLGQIEARVMAFMVGDEALLSKIRNGFGVYEAAAATAGIYGGEPGTMKKKEKLLYAMVKARVLALQFGCAWEKYINAALIMAGYDVCARDRINPETGKPVWGSAARAEVAEFREQNPKIVEFWKRMQNLLSESVGRNLNCELPSWRTMVFADIRSAKKKRAIKEYDENGKVVGTTIKEITEFSVDGGRLRSRIYGSMACQNIVQGVARDVFGEAMLRMEDRGIPVIFHVHDEAITEVPLGFDKKIVEDLMTVTPEWMEGCPLSTEAEVSNCYLK